MATETERPEAAEAPQPSQASEATSPASRRVRGLKRPTFPTEERACAECGETFEATRLEYLGETIVNDVCPKCTRRLDGPLFMEAERATPAPLSGDQIRDVMGRLGINVRKHGHLRLHELDDVSARATLERFVETVISAGRWKETETLYLYGNVGTGKSQAAVCTVRELITRGVPASEIVYDRGRAMVTQLQDRYTSGDVDAFSTARRRALLWIYEDAGTEKLTPDSFRVLEDVLDAREGHPTIITTNLPRQEFANRWAGVAGWERLRSRLGPYVAVEFTGPDRRLA